MNSVVSKDIEQVFFTEEDINKKVVELGKQISEDYKDKKPILLGILKGSFIFLSDLSRKLTIDHTVEVKKQKKELKFHQN